MVANMMVNNFGWTFTSSLNMCSSHQFLQAQVYPTSRRPSGINAELWSKLRQFLSSALEMLDCIPWFLPPLIVKHMMYAKYLKICSGLWSVLMNGFPPTGQLLEAAEHYEAFHQLTQGRIWTDETGRFLNLLACESLLRTYRLLSDKMLENKEYKQAIRILIKASEIAKAGGWKRALSHPCL